MKACESCGLAEFETDPAGQVICVNCDRPQPGVRVRTVPCPTPRCGQPVPADPAPGQHCLVCGKPIKTEKRPARASVR